MATPSARRPRFLDALPDSPDVAPLKLAPAPSRPAPRAPSPRPPAAGASLPPGTARRGEAQDTGVFQAPIVTAAELADLRRDALARVAPAIETLRAHSAHLGELARADALEIGFAVARAILATELRQNPEALFSLVRAAIRRAGESRRIVVRVAPEDLDVLQAGLEERRAAAETVAAARVELRADRSLKTGDCVVEADFGRIDGRIETRLSELRRAVDAAADGELREGVA